MSLYGKQLALIERHATTRGAFEATEELQKALVKVATLYDALESIAEAWDAIDAGTQIPEQLNNPKLWGDAHEALSEAME